MENTLKIFAPGPGTLNPEDALPIVESKFLLVADGLGGTGGSAHATIADGAMATETFFDTVFSGIFESSLNETAKETLKSYVSDSLNNYFSLSTEEKRSRSCKYTSGYFASRLVSTLMYGFLLELGESGVLEWFQKFTSNPATTQEIEGELGNFFAQKLSTALHKAAENGHFVDEARIVSRNKLLLPSTLVTVLYDEHESYVDAIYLWAGDSRGYAWDENGLIQITADHESNGVMNNQINLSCKFYVSCKYIRVPKPCALFCTSDGCYSCMTSPLDFEYYFFEQIKNGGSFSEAEELLRMLYGTYSEDDTSTVAMKVFGYESFDSFKAAVCKRIQTLKDVYETELPGIFTVNYQINHDSAKNKIAKVAKTIDLNAEPGLNLFVFTKLSSTTEIDQKKAAIREKLTKQKEQLESVIKKNYLLIAHTLYRKSVHEECYDLQDLRKNALVFIDLEASKEKFINSVVQLESEFDSLSELLKELFSKLKEFNSITALSDSSIGCYDSLYDLADALYDIFYGKNKNLRNCTKAAEKLEKRTEKYALEHLQYICNVLNGLLDGSLDVALLAELNCFGEIQTTLSSIHSLEVELADDSAEALIRAEMQGYWEKNRVPLLCEFYKSHSDDALWGRLGTEIQSAIAEYETSKKSLQLRDSLYDRYNQYYHRV